MSAQFDDPELRDLTSEDSYFEGERAGEGAYVGGAFLDGVLADESPIYVLSDPYDLDEEDEEIEAQLKETPREEKPITKI